MKTTLRYALTAAALGLLPVAFAAEVDCLELAATVKTSASAKPSEVLQLVEKEVAANPGCACEVVKAAIQGAKADPATVASIVEAASSVAPDQMRLISQCAVAVSPEALADVQAVVARLDPNRGESGYSAKSGSSAKSAKGGPAPQPAPAWNPLNFPGEGPVGPTPGGSPGSPGVPLVPPVYPPVIYPPIATLIGFWGDGYDYLAY